MAQGNQASPPPTAVREIAVGVSQVTAGAPVGSHVYLIESPRGPIAFDSGVKGAGEAILAAAGGAVERLVLSHAHADHRGAAAELGAPIYCHPDEVADAEGDAGRRYTDFGRIENERLRGLIVKLNRSWDGGPVEIAGTVLEGEAIAGFRVVHTPGHAPGQIALFREADRLLLAADAVFTVHGETGKPAPARVASPFSNWDTERARESIRRLIPLRPSAVWLGHGEPLLGDDIAQQLARAAGLGSPAS